MNIISPFRVCNLRKVNTRSVSDPDQYDVEINSARGFSAPKSKRLNPVKMQTVKQVDTMIYDPDQYDPDANQRSRYSPPMDEASHLIDNLRIPVDSDQVTRSEVLEAQDFWAQSIVDISNSFLTGGD